MSDEIHIHCEPVPCPKCDGRMVPQISSFKYVSKEPVHAHYYCDDQPTEYRHRYEVVWQCVNCGHTPPDE